MKLFNFFKKKVEIEEEVESEVQSEVQSEETSTKLNELERITYGSFYTWHSTTNDLDTTMVWDYKEKDIKVLPPNDKAIGMINTDDTYCIDPDNGKQFFIFTPSAETKYKAIRAFDIKDILIELDRQKIAIKEERDKEFMDNRIQYLKNLNSEVKVDLCNKSMNNE